MTRVLAIDPGSEQSAWVVYDGKTPIRWEKESNQSFVDRFSGSNLKSSERLQARNFDCLSLHHLAIETLHPRGMPTAIEEMQTQLWAGRFIERIGLPFTQIDRKDEKMTLCGRCAKVTDSNIRAAIIDRFGGKDKAIGKKKSPGLLYGMSGDCWQALAVAICWFEMHGAND